MIKHFIMMSVALENILNDPWASVFAPYTDPLQPFPMIFFSFVFIAVPTVVAAWKTDHPVPPFIVLIMGTLLVSEIVSQALGFYFKLLAGIFAGLAFYVIVFGGR